MLCRGGNGFLWPLLPASPRCPRERRDSVNIIVLGVESSSRVCAYHKAIDFPNQIHSSLPRNVPHDAVQEEGRTDVKTKCGASKGQA